MRKFLLSFTFLYTSILLSQQVIIDEKFEKNNSPVFYEVLKKSNKLIIGKGKYYGISTNGEINNILSYDKNGNKELLLENVKIMDCDFSVGENAFNAAVYSKLRGDYKYNYYFDNKKSPLILRKDYGDFDQQRINGTNFNDKYFIFLSNEKGKDKLNLEKNEVYLEVYDIITKKHKKVKIENINKERLLGSDKIKYEEELGFSIKIIDNNSFDFITKSISKDYKSTTLYRSIFDFDGNLIQDISYNINLPNDYLAYSNSDATYKKNGKHDRSVEIFGNDLAINNYEVDNSGNVYVYGLISKKAKDLNDSNEVSGFYVYKFDQNGNKIWEFIKEINDPKGLNKKYPPTRLNVSLEFVKNQVLFKVGTDFINEYFHYALIDNQNGSLDKASKVTFSEKMMSVTEYKTSFVPAYYKLDFNKKIFVLSSALILSDYNTKFLEYLKNLNVKSEVYFNAVFAHEGIWVLESDNNSYYKVLYFD